MRGRDVMACFAGLIRHPSVTWVISRLNLKSLEGLEPNGITESGTDAFDGTAKNPLGGGRRCCSCLWGFDGFFGTCVSSRGGSDLSPDL
jgi:hypothetical protein